MRQTCNIKYLFAIKVSLCIMCKLFFLFMLQRRNFFVRIVFF